jgi:hypothetical protein
MFTYFCPVEQAEVMIWTSDIDGIINTREGIDVHFHCTCGHRAVLQTGAGRTERVVTEATVA